MCAIQEALQRHAGQGLSRRRDLFSELRIIEPLLEQLLRELMTGYGKVSILWYDEPCPMGYGGEWDSAAINRRSGRSRSPRRTPGH